MRKTFWIPVLILFVSGILYANVSPWDAWRLGYTCFEQGEGCRDRGEYTKALKAFQEALEHYNSVRRARPDWNQKVIARRIADCERECERMKRLLGDSEPAPEEMAESGAAALRPASTAVAKEMDDIRKQLSEAKNELALLRQQTSARRNYEQEITQLLRDQKIAKERYILLERRYRDLDRASREPDRKVQELNELLLEEKMQTEQLKKQLQLHERRRKSEDARFLASENRRRSLEKQLGEKLAQIARLDSESAGLRNFQKESADKLTRLNTELDDLQKKFTAAEQERNRCNDELVRLKQQLVIASGNAASVKKRERELREELALLNAQRSNMQIKLDSSLKEIEGLKLQLIRIQVVESAKQELERHVASQQDTLKKLDARLETEKKLSEGLKEQVAALQTQIKEHSAIDKLNTENRDKEIKRLRSELETFRSRTGISENKKIQELQKELAELRSRSGKTSELLLKEKLEKELLEKEKKQLNAELENTRKAAKKEIADSSEALQKKLRAAEESAAKSRALLEKNLNDLAIKNRQNAQALEERNQEIRKLNAELAKRPAGNANVQTEKIFAEENRKLQGEIQILQQQIQSRDSMIARSGAEMESVKKQNEELISAIQKTRDGSNKISADNAALRTELERERAAAGSVAAELQRMREQKVEIEQDLKSALDRADRLEKRLSNRDSEDFKRLTASQDERKQLSEKVAGLQNELARLRVDTETLRQGNLTQKKELDTRNAEFTKVAAERDRLKEDRLKHLTAIGKLAGIEKKFETLKKDFSALQAENKENKLLVEAAKPREAELAQIKLRLTELDQLKAQLVKEQRLNEELKNANRRLESERGNLIILRSKLNNANKRIGELEPLIKEIEVLKKLNAELAVAKNLEADLAKARAQLNSFESVKLELDHSKKRIRKLELEKLESDRRAARARNLATGTQLLSAELEAARKAADELAKDKSLREMELARLRTRLNEITRLEGEVERLRKLKSANDPAMSVELQQYKRQAKKSQMLENALTLQKKETERIAARLEETRKENTELRLRAAEKTQLAESVKNLTAVNETLQKNLTPNKKLMAELKKENALLKAESAALKKLRIEAAQQREQLKMHKKDAESIRQKMQQFDILAAENALLKKQNAEIAKIDGIKKSLLLAQDEIRKLRSAAKSAENFKKLLLQAETRNAEKQAQLDRSKLLLSTSEQLKKELLTQRQENSSIQLELSRTRAENDRIRLQLLQTETLQRELERQKRLTAELVSVKGLESELAQAKLRLAEFEQIKQELARITRYNNELTEIRQKLEKELAERGSSGERQNMLFDVVSTIPAGKPEDYTASGKIAEADGSYELAIWNYEQALKIKRNHAPAAARLGAIFLDRRNYQQAVNLFAVARAADPVNTDLACKMAEAYIGLKRYGNALAILSPLAERKGDDYNVQMQMGRALAGAGNYRDAEARLRIAIRRAPAKEFTPRLELAKFLLATDVRRLDEAARIYEAARVAGAAPDIDLEPKLGGRLDERREVSGFLLNAAKEAEKSSDWKAAGWYYKQLVEMGREKDRYIPRLAFALYKSGNSAGALETLAFNRTTALGTLVSAFIQLSGKEYPAMLASARKAVALNSGKPVLLPLDWSELANEFERLKRAHSSEMTEALRRAFRIR